MQTKIADLTAKNTAVATAYASISNSRIARNETLYSSSTGLVETANEVKKYIKSVFGASSPQFAQVKGIQFKIIKNPIGNTRKVWYGASVVITYSKTLKRLNFRFQRKFWTKFFTNVNLPTEEELTMFELEHGEDIANLVHKISSDNQKLGFNGRQNEER